MDRERMIKKTAGRELMHATRLLHQALVNIITEDFLLENESILVEDLLDLACERIDKHSADLLQSQRIKPELLVALYSHIPKITTRVGFDTQWIPELGTLNSKAIFQPAIGDLLNRWEGECE